MADKSFFIDTTVCSACRGCQMACKQWNRNETEITTQLDWGSHQNPPDLSAETFKLVRFSELEEAGALKWLFFPDQCRHCIDPLCLEVSKGLGLKIISKDPATGAVLFDRKVRIRKSEYEEIRSACPYDIPRWNEKKQCLTKCTMCFDRITNGLVPACVQACPTGALHFGDRDKILALAEQRLNAIKGRYPKANLLNPETVRTIFLVSEDAGSYHQFAWSKDSGAISRLAALKQLARPLFSGLKRV